MDIALFVVGGVLVLGGMWAIARRDNPHLVGGLVLLVFALAFSGLGRFGLPFMREYIPFVDSLRALVEAANPAEAYTEFAAAVAAGDVPEDAAVLGLTYMIERPVEGTETALSRAVAGATDVRGKNLLEEAQREFEAKQVVAETLVRASEGPVQLTPEKLRNLDTATRAHLYRPLERLPDQRLQELGIPRSRLRQLTQVPKRSR